MYIFNIKGLLDKRLCLSYFDNCWVICKSYTGMIHFFYSADFKPFLPICVIANLLSIILCNIKGHSGSNLWQVIQGSTGRTDEDKGQSIALITWYVPVQTFIFAMEYIEITKLQWLVRFLAQLLSFQLMLRCCVRVFSGVRPSV